MLKPENLSCAFLDQGPILLLLRAYLDKKLVRCVDNASYKWKEVKIGTVNLRERERVHFYGVVFIFVETFETSLWCLIYLNFST